MTDTNDTNIKMDDDEMSRGLAAGMDKFASTFEASARRWELVVYPSLLAFIVLAGYGFFLIYTLTNDVGRMARSIETMVVSMDDIVDDIHAVSGNVAQMSANLTQISSSMLLDDIWVRLADICVAFQSLKTRAENSGSIP